METGNIRETEKNYKEGVNMFWYIILGLVILLGVIAYASDIKEKEERKIAEQIKQEEHRKLLAAEKESIQQLENTSFFKEVYETLSNLIKEDIILQIEDGKEAQCPYRFDVEKSGIRFNSMAHYRISFNELGYKNLTEEERITLEKVLKAKGFRYIEAHDGYSDYIVPDNTYWKPIIEKLISEHNEKFKSIF